MNKCIRSALLFAATAFALVLSARAQTIQLTATLNAAQEASGGSSSTATGSALMVYNVATNTYTLSITLNNFPNAIVSSNLNEGLTGATGTVVKDLGAEGASYTRSGNTLTATFFSQTYAGTPLTLLQKGSYLNFMTAAFPLGEVRGQLIAQPVKLTAIINSAQEIAPATGVSQAFGGAYILYDPSVNSVTTRISLYNFTNTLTASHYHEDPPTISGPVVLAFGGAAVYVKNGTNYNQTFANQTYSGHPLTLLTGGAYVNFHSNIYPGGEIRGQVYVSNETPSSRIVNTSTRGVAGTGNGTLITGFVVSGAEPILALVSIRGPSLAPFGVTNTLADPQLTIWNSAGALMASNSGYGSAFDVPNITSHLYMPLMTAEPAQLLVLPPGGYSVQASSVSGASGVVLIEAFDAR